MAGIVGYLLLEVRRLTAELRAEAPRAVACADAAPRAFPSAPPVDLPAMPRQKMPPLADWDTPAEQ